jgi:hypothetical protein
MIEKNKTYKIKGNSGYFKDKYGTSNPTIIIEDTWMNVGGKSWMCSDGNPACMLYGMRAGMEHLPTDNNVYYGKIQRGKAGALGELVHESELEAV